jgi:hypothetical protein
MTFSISVLVLARYSHIKPDSEDGGLIWVEGWYQGRYGKFHVIIFLSHILHWHFPSIAFYIYSNMLKCVNCYWNTIVCISLCIIFPCTLKAKYIIFETTAQIPEVESGSKYGHMRANTDICPVFALGNTEHWHLAIIEHAKTNILQQNMW